MVGSILLTWTKSDYAVESGSSPIQQHGRQWQRHVFATVRSMGWIWVRYSLQLPVLRVIVEV